MAVTMNFQLGQVVKHRLSGYRGVIIDADPEFQLSEDWYDQVAKSRPPPAQTRVSYFGAQQLLRNL